MDSRKKIGDKARIIFTPEKGHNAQSGDIVRVVEVFDDILEPDRVGYHIYRCVIEKGEKAGSNFTLYSLQDYFNEVRYQWISSKKKIG